MNIVLKVKRALKLSDLKIHTQTIQPSLQSKTVNPSTEQQNITYDANYNGLSNVVVNGVNSSIDSNIQSGNIRSGVTILGVLGNTPGPSYTLLKKEEVTASTTSTSIQTLATINVGSELWTKDKIIYIRVRDKAGSRNDHFIGTDNYCFNVEAYKNTTSISTNFFIRYIFRNFADDLQPATASSSCYGVYPSEITKDGSVIIKTRYNSSTSKTIDGTYVIEIYSLDFPNNEGMI